MKYDGRYLTLFGGKQLDTIKHIKKKKKQAIAGKRILSNKEAIRYNFSPTFSLHAIERLAQRIQKPRYKDVCLQVGKYWVTGPLLGPWLDPGLIRHAIEDMKSNVATRSYRSDYRKEIAIRGKLAYYIVSANMEVVTILPYEYADGEWYKRYQYHLCSVALVHSYFKTPQILA